MGQGNLSWLRYQARKAGAAVTEPSFDGKFKFKPEFIFSLEALEQYTKNIEAAFLIDQQSKQLDQHLQDMSYNLEQLEKDSPYNQY